MDETMDKKRPLSDLMRSTMDKIREMADTNTIVGQPITTPDGVTLIPISRVSMGFGCGGADYGKTQPKDFGGGSGAGVTIQPVAFLTVYQGEVRLVSVDNNGSTAEGIVGMIPDVLQKVKGMFSKKKDADDFSEITQDDIDMV